MAKIVFDVKESLGARTRVLFKLMDALWHVARVPQCQSSSVGSLAEGMSFEEVQREYDLINEEIRAALDPEQHHPLPT